MSNRILNRLVHSSVERELLFEQAREHCKKENLNYSEFIKTQKFKRLFYDLLASFVEEPPEIKKDLPTGIAVDASTTGGNPGYCECRGIDLQTGEIVFSEQIGIATNNIAEFLAIAYGANYIVENNLNCTLWSDSKICINWYYQKECKTNIFAKYPEKSKQNPNLVQQISEGLEMVKACNVDVKFWNKHYKGENPADYQRKHLTNQALKITSKKIK